jgi:hypothetical protein
MPITPPIATNIAAADITVALSGEGVEISLAEAP